MKQFLLSLAVITMFSKQTRGGTFPFCNSGESPCYTRWNGPKGPEGTCYNPQTHVCWPTSGGESVVCAKSETLCGKQCYKPGGGKVCCSYDTLCDQNQSPCIMSELRKGQCYNFLKETCFRKVVCPNFQVPCPNDDTKCCSSGK